MRVVLISVLTGLVCGIWLYIALIPFNPTRLAVYGFLFLATGLGGIRACDRVRHQEGMWGRQ